VLKDRLYAFVPQQERPPGKLGTPLQHVLKDGLYAFIPQQERPSGEFRTPLQLVLKEGLYCLNPHTALENKLTISHMISNTMLQLIYILVQIYKTYLRGWAFINRFEPIVCLCLSQAMPRFSMRYVVALFMFNVLT
jgi:hypothetical protein